MKLSFVIRSGSNKGSIKEVRNFREGRYVAESALSEAMELCIDIALREAIFKLNSNEPELRDPRLLDAIGSTAYWEYERKKLKKSGDKFLVHMVVKNTQKEGIYYARRKSKITNEIVTVPVIVANLALVRMYPPHNYIKPTGLPREAPADFLSFYIGNRYIKKRSVSSRGGHERYKRYIIGTIRDTLVEEFKAFGKVHV